MSDKPLETELKFALGRDRVDEPLAETLGLAGVAPSALTSTYFDTPRRSLRRAKIALRVRRGPGGFVQTLKDAGDGVMSRGEWETKLSGPDPAPERLAKTPAARLLSKGVKLTPQFTVEVARRSAVVSEGETQIEISLDEGEVRAGLRRAAFAELELELKSGPVQGLFTLARRLGSAADLTLSFTTKAARGFALAARTGTRAVKFEAPELDKRMSAGEAFAAVARATLRQVVGNAERLRHRATPEVIHQLRVGLRRFRSLVTTFKAVVADARLPALKAELEWLTGELNAARNLDVLLAGDYRAGLAGNAQGLKDLTARLRGARRIAYARAGAAVESERFRRLALDLLIWIEAGPWTADAERQDAREELVARFAAKALKQRRRKVVRGGRDIAELDPEVRHKLRIEAKKLRYAADAFEGLFGRKHRAKTFLKALRAVQDDLGALNDLVVGEALTQDAAGGPEANVAERLAKVRESRTGELLGKAQGSLDRLAETKGFWGK